MSEVLAARVSRLKRVGWELKSQSDTSVALEARRPFNRQLFALMFVLFPIFGGPDLHRDLGAHAERAAPAGRAQRRGRYEPGNAARLEVRCRPGARASTRGRPAPARPLCQHRLGAARHDPCRARLVLRGLVARPEHPLEGAPRPHASSVLRYQRGRGRTGAPFAYSRWRSNTPPSVGRSLVCLSPRDSAQHARALLRCSRSCSPRSRSSQRAGTMTTRRSPRRRQLPRRQRPRRLLKGALAWRKTETE